MDDTFKGGVGIDAFYGRPLYWVEISNGGELLNLCWMWLQQIQ